MRPYGWPSPQGLYDTAVEKDACGIGFVANFRGIKSNAILRKGLEGLLNHCHFRNLLKSFLINRILTVRALIVITTIFGVNYFV
jgi:hypothetical protein